MIGVDLGARHVYYSPSVFGREPEFALVDLRRAESDLRAAVSAIRFSAMIASASATTVAVGVSTTSGQAATPYIRCNNVGVA